MTTWQEIDLATVNFSNLPDARAFVKITGHDRRGHTTYVLNLRQWVASNRLRIQLDDPLAVEYWTAPPSEMEAFALQLRTKKGRVQRGRPKVFKSAKTLRECPSVWGVYRIHCAEVDAYYVGISSNLKERLQAHARSGLMNFKHGDSVDILVVDAPEGGLITWADLQAAEQEFIQRCKDRGQRVLNVTAGANGRAPRMRIHIGRDDARVIDSFESVPIKQTAWHWLRNDGSPSDEFTMLDLNMVWCAGDIDWRVFLTEDGEVRGVLGNRGPWQAREEVTVSVEDIASGYAAQHGGRDLRFDLGEVRKRLKLGDAFDLSHALVRLIPIPPGPGSPITAAETTYFLRNLDSKLVESAQLPPELVAMGYQMDSRFNNHGRKGINAIVRVIDPSGQGTYIKVEENASAILAERLIGELWVQLRWPGVHSRPRLLADEKGLAIPDVGGDGIHDCGTVLEHFKHLPFENSHTLRAPRAHTIRRITLESLRLREDLQASRFLLVNAVTGNSDRHSANLKYGVISSKASGRGVLLPIDHGRCLFNNDGRGRGHIVGTPADAVTGRIGNPHQLLRPVSKLISTDREAILIDSERWLVAISNALVRMSRNPVWRKFHPELQALADRANDLQSDLDTFFDEIGAVVR